MSKFVNRLFKGIGAHLSDAAISGVLSGELPGRRLARGQKHLQRCWKCRARYVQLDRAALRFVEFHNSTTESEESDSPQRREMLRLRIQEVERERGHVTGWQRLLLPVRFKVSGIVRAGIAGAGIVSIIVAVVIWQRNVQTVSAAEILRQASMAQTASRDSIKDPVVYQKLHIRRRPLQNTPDAAMTLEVWTDLTHARMRATVGDWSQVSGSEPETGNGSLEKTNARSAASNKKAAPPQLYTEIESAYESNQLDSHALLSPMAFSSWRNSVSPTGEAVRKVTLENGQPAYNITATRSNEKGPGKIAEAQLMVRANDWHTISEYLKVQTDSGSKEYEIAELDYRLAPLSELAATIFPSAANPGVIATVVAKPIPVVQTPTELDAAEVEVRIALHNMGADLGEPVEVERSADGEIVVEGMANTEQHKQELLQALQAIPHVVMRIETIDELEQTQRASNPSAGNTSRLPPSVEEEAPVYPDGGDALLPLQSQLEHYFVTQGGGGVSWEQASSSKRAAAIADAQAFSTKVLGMSDKTLSEAWALRQLSKRYSLEESSKLPTGSKQKLEALIRDHIRNLEQYTSSLRRLLTPVLVSVETAPAADIPGEVQSSESAGSSWPALSLNLFNTVNVIDQLNNSLFAGAGLPFTNDGAAQERIRLKRPEECAQDLLVAFSQLQIELVGLQQRIKSEFL